LSISGTPPDGKEPPSKQQSAYSQFCKSKRAEIKQNHPNWNVQEVNKELGRMWREHQADKIQLAQGKTTAQLELWE